MFKEIFESLKDKNPLIHNITNYVTVNDCANITYACGASPIMVDEEAEVEEITSISNALNINIGTLNKRTINSMFIAAKRASELNHPIVLDPVGAGASNLRTTTAQRLVKESKISVIRGNISEIKALSLGLGGARGVDADINDAISDSNLEKGVEMAKGFSKRTGSVIAITGAIDIVADSTKAYCIRNGHKMMGSITGTGCQLSSLIASFVGGNPDNILDATAVAVCLMGYAGEKAYKRLSKEDGNSSYRNYIIDAIYNMSAEELEKNAKYEVR